MAAGGTQSGSASATKSGGAGATASGAAGATGVGGSGGAASGGVGGTATGGADATKTGGSGGGTITGGVGGIGSGGSGGTATGTGGAAKGGSTGSDGAAPEPIADGGTDGDAMDLGAILSEKTLTYWATSRQRPPDGGYLSRTPSDQDFIAITPVAEDILVFYTDASALEMTAIPRPGVPAGGVPLTGTRTTTDQGKWTYRLTPATGGRLVVWLSGTTILASKTLYGSGVPVTDSSRGELRSN